MALIDRYAAIDALTDTELRRNLDSVYDDDMKRIRRAAQRVIAQVPAVDAIPVEWLRQFQDKMPNTAAVMGVDVVLKMWEKEAR